jgi:hypothetical protein
MELPQPINLTAKLYRLKDCLDKLDADDQQFVNAMVDRLERGERPLLIQLLRIKDMPVPGEAPLVDPIWREGTVTALRKDLDQVIWRYMPLEQMLFLLSTGHKRGATAQPCVRPNESDATHSISFSRGSH